MTRFEQTGAALAQDGQEVVVRAVRLVPCGGKVFCASVPGNSPTAPEWATRRAEAQRRLVTLLWEHLRTDEDPPEKRPRPPNNVALPVRVAHDELGRPHLRSGERRSPSISFSEGGGRAWAALCGEEAEIGIDVAGSDEFPATYPFLRVFHGDELHHALGSAGGDLGRAAALLWSIKEAVVKALGCAFHGVEPRDITVYPGPGDDDVRTFPVGLSGKALRRLPWAADRPLWVQAFPQDKMWLSLALLVRHG